jgi:hypothetical protein
MPSRKYPSENKALLAARCEQRRIAALSELERLAEVNDRSHNHLRKLATLMDVANDPAAASTSGEPKRIRRRA